MIDANLTERTYIAACEFNGKMAFCFLKENNDFQVGSWNFGSSHRAHVYALLYALKQRNPMYQSEIITYNDQIYSEFLDFQTKKDKFFTSKLLSMDLWMEIKTLLGTKANDISMRYDLDSGRDWLLKARRYAEKAAGKI